MRNAIITVVALTGGCLLPPPELETDQGALAGCVVDLRADSNRDGFVDVTGDTDDAVEDRWDRTGGAVVLPNLDLDDKEAYGQSAHRCDRRVTFASRLACSDASDTVVNGPRDELDLARLFTVAMPDAPAGAYGRVTVASARVPIRVFRRTAAGFRVLYATDRLTTAEVRGGVELAVEATDVDRSGHPDVEVTYTVRRASGAALGADRVQMRVAPVLFAHHAQKAARALIAPRADNPAFARDFEAACRDAGVNLEFSNATELANQVWIQDVFEVGSATMPGIGGGTQVVSLAFLFKVYAFERPAADAVLYGRGPNVGAVLVTSPAQPTSGIDMGGNFEVLPPHAGHPYGRVLRGSGPGRPEDPALRAFVDGQRLQDVLDVDTGWLAVGHVDEIMTFVPAPTPRGWIMLAADPRLALSILDDLEARGHGDLPLFADKPVVPGASSPLPQSRRWTVHKVLTTSLITGATLRVASKIDAAIGRVRAATGLEESEIVRLPVLYFDIFDSDHKPYALAFTPSLPNGASLSPTVFAASDPRGPNEGEGDVFRNVAIRGLAPFGIHVDWIDDWEHYHLQDGNTHCGSQVIREVSDTPWWTVP